ncbi:MAG TPA: glycosyltransferase family 2 protein [Candidatus Saccharimonadales bacterium]|nr:glycosyltransferase family 2 protein [Candidatus Saccharimonadales bacterium]
MRKTPLLYRIILCAWLLLVSVAVVPLLAAIHRAEPHGWLVTTLVVVSTFFIGYFWLNGVKDLVYTLYYYLRKRIIGTLPPHNHWPRTKGFNNQPRVVMVYCTCNDFNGDSLLASMQQDYPNREVVILDDSKKPEYLQKVDAFAQKHTIKVVRRDSNVGFKAGNLNNYLQTAGFDYFVILDSDEIVPRNFITRALDYFAFYQNMGILQANHIATRNRNKFMNLFAVGVNSHWITYQTVKHAHGFLSLLGHGAMVSRECYRAAGGFPHLVAEDLCFSIEARGAGYYTGFAPDITCEEEYPIDYLAFKKRHSKWTQGNMEFIKKYTGRIIKSPMSWFEKLDIILFTYSLPLTFFFSLYILINVVFLPLMQYEIKYPFWLLIPTGLFLLAPMLNDIFYYARTMHPVKLVSYLLHTMLLYGSMFFVSLRSSLKSLFGKSVFLVTPKDQQHISLGEAFRANRGELLFGVALLAVSIVCDNTPLPTLLIVIPGLLSVYLSLIANRSADIDSKGLAQRPAARATEERRAPPRVVQPELTAK